MFELENGTHLAGLSSEQYNLTFDVAGITYLYWSSGDEFRIAGTVAAYQEGVYVGKYSLTYTATGATYATYNGDDILGATGGQGTITSLVPSSTTVDEIILGARPNVAGWGLFIRDYGNGDIRLEGDWSLGSWATVSYTHLTLPTILLV